MTPQFFLFFLFSYALKYGIKDFVFLNSFIYREVGTMSKEKKLNIVNWILGNLFCSLGVAFATKADYGLSMIAANPYILHVSLRDALPWFTQGTAEYFFEAAVLIILCIILKRFKLKYLLTFAEALFAGLLIDGWFLILGGNAPYAALPMKLLSFVLGLVLCALGVAFFFKTTLPLQVYETAVVEISDKFGFDRSKVKLAHDCIMLGLALILSLVLTGRLTGIGIGTVITTLLNSSVIKLWSKLLDKLES